LTDGQAQHKRQRRLAWVTEVGKQEVAIFVFRHVVLDFWQRRLSVLRSLCS